MPRPSSAPPLQMTDMAPGVTNVGYWDEAAKDWDCVHDTFATDEKGVIAKNLAQHCRNDQQVIDFVSDLVKRFLWMESLSKERVQLMNQW